MRDHGDGILFVSPGQNHLRRTHDGCPAIAPLLNAVEVNVDTWHDDRMPAGRYGALQKRSGAALVIDRPTRNDWSKVVLRVMFDAAQDAGAVFDPIRDTNAELKLRPELNSLCEKAIVMGRAIRSGSVCPRLYHPGNSDAGRKVYSLPGQLEQRDAGRSGGDKRCGQTGKAGHVHQPAGRALAADGLRYGRE